MNFPNETGTATAAATTTTTVAYANVLYMFIYVCVYIWYIHTYTLAEETGRFTWTLQWLRAPIRHGKRDETTMRHCNWQRGRRRGRWKRKLQRRWGRKSAKSRHTKWGRVRKKRELWSGFADSRDKKIQRDMLEKLLDFLSFSED